MGYYDHEGTYWPENRLTGRLAEIKEMNRDFGVRAAGGGVPVEVLIEHKGVTVLSEDEVASRDAAWAAEQAAGQEQPTLEAPAPKQASFVMAVPVDPTGPLTVLSISIDPPLIVTNKGNFPIAMDEAKFFKKKALGVVIASLTAAMEDADDPTGAATP